MQSRDTPRPLVWPLGCPPSAADHRVLGPFRNWNAVFLLHFHEVVLSLPERLGGLVQTVASRIHRRCRHVDGLLRSFDLLETVELSFA